MSVSPALSNSAFEWINVYSFKHTIDGLIPLLHPWADTRTDHRNSQEYANYPSISFLGVWFGPYPSFVIAGIKELGFLFSLFPSVELALQQRAISQVLENQC